MHIGGQDTFSAIGAVDSPVIRDPKTGHPIVPGSSLKGKLRALLSQSLRWEKKISSFDEDPEAVKLLFGSAKRYTQRGCSSQTAL